MRHCCKRVFSAAAVFAALAGTPLCAQDSPNNTPPSSILTIDQEALFANSLWGKRVQDELSKASHDLQTENRKIEAELTAEEKSLTDQRPTMAAEQFRKLADDFDARVTGIRAAQDNKARDLSRLEDDERKAFAEAAFPIIGEIMVSRGAVAVLDKRAILLSIKAIDATAEVLKRVDAKLGSGPASPAP